MRPRSAKEIESILLLDPIERYNHFVKRVVDFQATWGLYDDGWAMVARDDRTLALALWPHREYAMLCATDDWSHYIPKKIALDELLDIVLPDLDRKNSVVAVFMTPTGSGIVRQPMDLRNDLMAEEEKYQ